MRRTNKERKRLARKIGRILEKYWYTDKSVKEIAAIAGVKVTDISYFVHTNRNKFPSRILNVREQIDRRNEMVMLYQLGETTAYLARKFHLNVQTVRLILNSSNKFNRINRTEIYEDLVEMWEKGYTYAEIADKYEYTPKQIRAFFSRHREDFPLKPKKDHLKDQFTDELNEIENKIRDLRKKKRFVDNPIF